MAVLKRREVQGQPSGWPETVSPTLQRVYAARGVLSPTDSERNLSGLISPWLLGDIEKAAKIIGDAIIHNRKITIAGDYDCDGATGSAVAVRGLRILGGKLVNFIVPNRFVHGYGLSPALVDDMANPPDLIVTVDSGVSSTEGVAHAKDKGMQVVVTDHHLPGEVLPEADAIVNPNLKGDPFPSKMLAGVGVMFYVLLAVRSYLRRSGFYGTGPLPDLMPVLDLVALGTVADLVPLDRNNRILVQAGLERIRNGQACVGLQALLESSKRPVQTLVASDIAFSVAPRLNAAGRLENMSLGVMTLISDDPQEAQRLVAQLEEINQSRKDMQAEMVATAEEMVAKTQTDSSLGVVVFDKKWHAGVVGLVASKLKENLHRPVIAFAPAGENSDEVRGSGRSIPGFHLRDALAVVDARNPGLMPKYGGHAMAAGLSLKTADIDRFAAAFDTVVSELITEEMLEANILTDGALLPGELNLGFAHELRQAGPWGQAFPEPVFEGVFDVVDHKVLGEKHLKLVLADVRDGSQVDAIYFFGYHGEPPPGQVQLAFELSVNVWRDRESLQLIVRHLEPA